MLDYQQWRGNEMAIPSIRLWEHDGSDTFKDLSGLSSPLVAIAVLGTLAAYASFTDSAWPAVWTILSAVYWIYHWVVAEIKNPGYWAKTNSLHVLGQLPIALTSLSYALVTKGLAVLIHGYYFLRWNISR